ncbi:MAG TPA: sigma-70 family RNA polymerase sigma factor [Polyangiaceae bacterium]|nr:sigma-70 family RNA polymerase sigma factor [Polyangiaceae bacterium]
MVLSLEAPKARGPAGKTPSNNLLNQPKAPADSLARAQVAYWYRTELPRVMRLVRRLGVASADVEDVAHEVFIVLQSRFTRLDRDAGLHFWLRAVTFRVCSNYRRRAARRRSESLAEVERGAAAGLLEHHSPRPDECYLSNERRELLHRALARLDPCKREVFLLSEMNDCTALEIATRMQVSPNTVASRLRAARRQIAQRLRGVRA